jgi:hypothetical protein
MIESRFILNCMDDFWINKKTPYFFTKDEFVIKIFIQKLFS